MEITTDYSVVNAIKWTFCCIVMANSAVLSKKIVD